MLTVKAVLFLLAIKSDLSQTLMKTHFLVALKSKQESVGMGHLTRLSWLDIKVHYKNLIGLFLKSFRFSSVLHIYLICSIYFLLSQVYSPYLVEE